MKKKPTAGQTVGKSKVFVLIAGFRTCLRVNEASLGLTFGWLVIVGFIQNSHAHPSSTEGRNAFAAIHPSLVVQLLKLVVSDIITYVTSLAHSAIDVLASQGQNLHMLVCCDLIGCAAFDAKAVGIIFNTLHRLTIETLDCSVVKQGIWRLDTRRHIVPCEADCAAWCYGEQMRVTDAGGHNLVL